MVKLADELKKLADRSAYPPRALPEARWGQLLREDTHVHALLADARSARRLVPLAELADVHSGVVPRANAFFLVRELPLAEVPDRFRVTARDYARVAVVEDGLKTRHKIERVCLRETLKGPEALIGPKAFAKTDERLFDCQGRSKQELRTLRANGALTYLTRGETVDYRVSEDSLKGGVPAERAQVKNRKPYWYSLHTPPAGEVRLVVPEHFDRRFLAALVPSEHDAVVIDTLYSIAPKRAEDAELMLASLNSLLTWYQLELRGRTQHGEGVLKVKIADWDGLLVLNPDAIGGDVRQSLLSSFSPLAGRPAEAVDQDLARPDRVAFDESYLRLIGAPGPEWRLTVERELRAAMGERHERARSVDTAKAAKALTRKVSAGVDAYASRVAGAVEPFPDPRTGAVGADEGQLILVSTPWQGALTVGEDLFTQGHVLAGDLAIAHAGELAAAQYVRAVLLHDPETSAVQVPAGRDLRATMQTWQDDVDAWRERFDQAAAGVVAGIADARTRRQVRDRALSLLHAQ
jgi:hypothetical protein